MKRVALLLVLLAGCATTARDLVVLGVEVDHQTNPERWADEADVISACAAKLSDPRLLNGLRVKVSETSDALHRDCLAVDAGACYVHAKRLAVVLPRADHPMPGFCHEAGHHLLAERDDDPDHCHLRSEVWAAIDGTTCTCRCPEPRP